eukprot:1738942-Amphidinium_carterae.1
MLGPARYKDIVAAVTVALVHGVTCDFNVQHVHRGNTPVSGSLAIQPSCGKHQNAAKIIAQVADLW